MKCILLVPPPQIAQEACQQKVMLANNYVFHY